MWPFRSRTKDEPVKTEIVEAPTAEDTKRWARRKAAEREAEVNLQEAQDARTATLSAEAGHVLMVRDLRDKAASEMRQGHEQVAKVSGIFAMPKNGTLKATESDSTPFLA